MGEALNHSAYLYICLPSSTLNLPNQHGSPMGITLESKKLPIFACAAFVRIEKQACDPELVEHWYFGIYLGTRYSLFRVYIISQTRFVVSEMLQLIGKDIRQSVLKLKTLTSSTWNSMRTLTSQARYKLFYQTLKTTLLRYMRFPIDRPVLHIPKSGVPWNLLRNRRLPSKQFEQRSLRRSM